MPPKPSKVLVVDDEANVLQVLSEGLIASGFEVETASNGAQALIKAFQFKPDMILLDISMPQMDGWQTLAKLRKNHETGKIPVAMLTARSETREVLRSREEGVLDYFIKPIEIRELTHFIHRYIYRA